MTRVLSVLTTTLACSGILSAATWVVSGEEPSPQNVRAAPVAMEYVLNEPPPIIQPQFGFVVEPCIQDTCKFSQLVEDWQRERGVSSSTSESILESSAYLSILAMGPKAVPLILTQMNSEGDDPDQWFWALQLLTGVNPVPEESDGNFNEMARYWFDWAADAGYIW